MPIALRNSLNTLKSLIKHSIFTILIFIIFAIIINLNTVIHPYLLADNRHYTFYFWNRLLSKEPIRYCFAMIYLFGLKSIFDNMGSGKLFFNLIYFVSTFGALAFQMMIEVRYFLIPYVILKMKLNYTEKILIVELFIYIIINALTINIFAIKDIYWKDFDYVQRLIW